jgi:formylglycine-generating enzyme required for sulfatase activity
MSKIKSATLCIVHCALCIGTALAVPTVTIDSVTQRWPWNNKVDITYTVAGGTDMSAHEYYKIKFKATVNGTDYVLDGSKDVIASTLNGTHTVTWTNVPAVKATGCTMDATMYATTGDYMIIDLNTGNMALEDMEPGDSYTVNPAAAIARYNTALYKTDRLVLRRVPRTADSAYPNGYRTGYDAQYGSGVTGLTYYNSNKDWTTDRDFYVGVFMVTVAQYRKVMGTNPGGAEFFPYDGNVADWCPVGAPTYNTLRNSEAASTALSSSASSVSVFERLNAMTGVGTGFDLPTEVMWEIAHRAGTTTMYFWYDGYRYGDVIYYIHCNDNRQKPAWSGNYTTTFRVGAYYPNHWGLYDTMGNLTELCRDVGYYVDLKDAPDAFTPKYDSTAVRSMARGWYWEVASDAEYFRSSARRTGMELDSALGWQFGFRVFFVAP